ncbi:hypothetical protein NY547_13210 [Cnuibacter physcomitrellae]|uniref:hypothetical protein n=1 Tax=Cnuibacter physcomitrellae TaxID=1619308 RepID=UPI002175EA8B|nr:hypothetical protein [Cnuibacter physcomitrellae]MCS5498202.1 hypothetical protein [Cnuibacter physcomitrellae]
MTKRDGDMLDWLSVVRVADVDAIRWALGAFAGAGGPVTVRRANMWITRLADVGLVSRARPNFRDGSVVWATHQAIGKSTPNLYRQTARHEVAVAAVSARYLAYGYTWGRDRVAPNPVEHQADGVATREGEVVLVEVELTPKTLHRYPKIFRSHASRMEREGVAQVVYFGTPDVARAVAREADKNLFHALRPRLVTMPVLDVRGSWNGPDYGLWNNTPAAATGTFVDEDATLGGDVWEFEGSMEGSRA